MAFSFLGTGQAAGFSRPAIRSKAESLRFGGEGVIAASGEAFIGCERDEGACGIILGIAARIALALSSPEVVVAGRDCDILGISCGAAT